MLVTTSGQVPIWHPSDAQVQAAQMTAFINRVAGHPSGGSVKDYETLYSWSIEQPEHFWPAVADFCGVLSHESPDGVDIGTVVVGGDRVAPPDPVLGPRWFPHTRLNFAENLLRFSDDRPAIAFWNEQGHQRTLTFAELHADVARVAAALRSFGVRPSDRVAGFMPNIPETVVAMLAATSLGAIWSSCSPDFGARGVLDRFGQITPKVLICADGYRYAGKEIDCLARVRELVDRIDSIERVIVVPYLQAEPDCSGIRGAVRWDALPAVGAQTLEFERFPFDHPLLVMFSSGTTGLPKCMVHGAGGTLLQHMKEQVLHTDLRRDDRTFYFTTCGWMMWNWLVSSLAVGATIVLYDGSPFAPRNDILWEMAERERVTVFGTSAKYLAMCEKSGLTPGRDRDLSAIRAILSTGSPLFPSSYDYVYQAIKSDVQLSSISGGTDIISCFALGNPIAPVWRGELQTRGLGMAVEVFDEQSQPVQGRRGELVCTKPFPSMPVAFWNDPDGSKYRSAFFDRFPNVWCQGDWAELTVHDGVIVHGRSDTTLNPGGVRIGTAEIYREVERLAEVVESVVVEQEMVPLQSGVHGPPDTRIVLFVRLREGLALNEELRERIRRSIRESTSPHHVPKHVIQVPDIPRTISGKISESAVRAALHGRRVEQTEALQNPQALDAFRDIPELRL